MRNLVVFAALALCAAQVFAANTHTVKFRRLNGTVFHQVEVEHGGSASLPAAPVETHFRFKGWDHGDWLSCVTNDINVYALYENDGSKTWSTGTNFSSKPIAEREEPYSLDEYFRMYDSVAWTDEFSRGSNTAVAVNSSYWSYDLGDRHKISYETSGGNQVESNGCLVLTVRREHAVRKGSFNWSTYQYDPDIEYDFTGGGIKSNNKVAFKHGRCEVRAKLTNNRGCGSSFWMMGNSSDSTYTELDVFEQPSGGDWISGGIHIPGRGKSKTIQNGGPGFSEDGVHFGHGFHRYGTIVNDREILWYMDDHIFRRIDVRDERYYMYRDRPLYVILSFGLHTNNWVQAPDAPINKDDLPELTDHVDFLVDYCRIYVNTNENNTMPYVPAVPGAKLSRPVNATVWRGWDMNYGKPSSTPYVNNINSGYVVQYYVKTALSEYFARDGIDALAFLTEPDVKTDRNMAEFDIPGYTTMFISANANAWNNDDNDGTGNQGRLQLFGGLMFNTRRFSVSESGVGLMTLSSDPAFTNCYAICADLREKETGARVKVVAANVTTTSGVDDAGGTVAQGFDTLFAKLNDMTNDNVIVFFQGMNQNLYNYIKSQADAKLLPPYSFVDKITTSPVYQCVYVTACASASAARPAKIPVTRSNLAASCVHNPQALQASVVFDELPAVDDGMTDTFDASDYAKSMEVTFSGYSGTALANFPVLVKLSTAITGFDYADFQHENGGDLRFTDSSGNLLTHEIDTWNPSGVSTVWVKVPSLAPNAKIFALFGCARPVRVDSSQVWDSDYVGVWHLGEGALPLKESSGVSVDFTRSTGKTIGYGSQGIVGGSVDFANGPSNAVVALDHDALDGFSKFTLEAWTKQDSFKSNAAAGIISKREAYNKNCSYYMYNKGGTTCLFVGTNNTGSAFQVMDNVKPTAGGWVHQACSVDMTATSSNAWGYVNGVAAEPKSIDFIVSVVSNRVGNLALGNLNANAKDNTFNGPIDEVRISKSVRSAAWLKATHDTVTQADFATYSFGDSPDPVDPQPECGSLATNDYAKAIDVTFSGAPSDATLTNFPVLVKLSTAISGFSYADFSRPNGGDLRFADSTGKLLPHEIDTWNSNGVSTVWVKVPSLTKDAAITAHYGYTGSGDPAEVDSKDVWDSNYVGVWHLGESALPMAESTGVSTPFASKTGTASYGAAGAVGGSVDFKAAKGTESFLTAADDDDLDGFNDFTVEMWTCQDTFYNANEAYAGTLVKRNARADNESWFTYQDKATRKPGIAYGNDAAASDRTLALANTLPAAGEWTHQAFVRTVSTSKVVAFVDGTNNSTTVKSSGAVFAGSAPLMLGGGGGQMSFPGRIDEVRISKTARSAAWVKATHDTVMNDSFATYAVQGVTPPVPQPVFAHEIDVTFSGYSGGSALADFPVLVRLSPNITGFSYADFQIANGGDLRFYDAAGNMLAHEIDTWNESGESTAWVKVPTLDASTSITAKYGCAEPPEAADPKSVWSNGYVGVWHLSARDGEMSQPDSAAGGRAFELDADYADGVSAGVDGAAGLAAAFHRRSDGKGAYRLDDAAKAFSGFTKFTLEYWTYQDDHEPGGAATEGYVMRKASAFDAYESSNNGRMALRMFISGGSSGGNYVNAEDVAGNKPPRAAWNHSVQVFDGTEDGVDGVDTKINRAVYLNGVRRGLSASSSLMGTMISNGNSLCLGNEAPGGTKSYRGAIDEVRISNTTRSEAWVKATHDTIANASFATYTLRGAPSSGYAAWIAGKGITGTAAAADKVTNGIANGVRYAFDIDPQTSTIGTPIIQVVRDANGNPSVQSRDLATGRDDVTFGILATEDLTDWSNAVLVPMTKFATDGLWRPTASESAGYVFPSQMFFKYTIEIQE